MIKRFFLFLFLFQMVLFNATRVDAARVHAEAVGVTLPPLGGMVQLLLPQSAPICLLRANADPHHSQLTPHQVEQLRRFTVLVRSSGDDGGWSGLKPRKSANGASGGASGSGVVDLWPQAHHAWLVPADVEHGLAILVPGLGALATPQQLAHQQSLAISRLQQLDRRWRQLLQPLKQRGVIMQHPAWQRLFVHYGIPVRAVLELSHHGHEASPRMLEKTLKLLRGANPPLLVAEVSHTNRMLDWLHTHAPKSQMVTLNALGSCGQPLLSLIADNQQILARMLEPSTQP
ncbi:MAG: zinc ABC transporter substrate-binding protein [Mariprofundales bacterium]|nr:zinc ABC transporter substrate-binding protein [Mariprofundales bacterium]